MRIFYASDTTPNSNFESKIWRNNLFLPLVDLGHDVIEFDYNLRETFLRLDPSSSKQKRFIKKNRPKLSKELLKQIQKAHKKKPIDLFFSYFYDACVLPETIDEIKSMGIKTINWYCNGSYQLHLVSQISPRYNYCLVPEKFKLESYKKLGANPIYCQEAANPNIYRPHKVKKEFDVTFVGQAYGERPSYLKYLLDHGIDARVWGLGWDCFLPTKPSLTTNQKLKLLFSKEGPSALKQKLSIVFNSKTKAIKKKLISLLPNKKTVATESCYIPTIQFPESIVGGVLSDTELIKMYSRSKINLSFSTCGSTHEEKNRIMQIRLRDFEVPMSGGFYMTEYFEELEDFFEIGKEIVCYKDKDDLVEKIKYYLAHDQEREKIAQAGRERCLRDHTWQKRFTMVFEKVFHNRHKNKQEK